MPETQSPRARPFYIVELGERTAAHDSLPLTAVQMAAVALAAGVLSLLLRAPFL